MRYLFAVKTPNGFGDVITGEVNEVLLSFMAAVNDDKLDLLNKAKGQFDLYCIGEYMPLSGKVKRWTKFKLIKLGTKSLLPKEIKYE